MNIKPRVMITVDVEAQPVRASTDHVNRLIYGTFDGSEEHGIGKMFDIADKYGFGVTCFLDYAEESLYGNKLLDVGRYISSRGHDLQVHLHPEFLPLDIFQKNNIERVNDLFKVTPSHASLMMNMAMDSHYKISKDDPVAFRGGGYRYNASILAELKRLKFKFNSCYNPSRENQPFNIGITKQFNWDNSIVELPVSCVAKFGDVSRFYEYNFNSELFILGDVERCVENHDKFLNEFFKRQGDDAIAVLVMHSWSFLNHNSSNGFYEPSTKDLDHKFSAIVDMISKKYSIVTAKQLSEHNFDVSDRVQHYMQNKFTIESVNSDTDISCEVCGASFDAFEDYNGNKRKCSKCGSVERQRAFASILKKSSLKNDLENKNILLISQSDSEKYLFSHIKNAKITTLELRSELKPDIVADICCMSDVQSSSYDVVFASHVLVHVHNLQKALSEISRVLKNDGTFISYEPSTTNNLTYEFSNIDEISAHYGIDIYKKYNIGRFRTFGELDIDNIFDLYFERKKFIVCDNATKNQIIWNVWSKIDFKKQFDSISTKINFILKDSCKFYKDQFSRLDEDEWIFFKNHVVRAGDEVDVYARLIKKNQRAIEITDINENIVASLDIECFMHGKLLQRFDANSSTEGGVPYPVGKLRIPQNINPGIYFIDKKWIFIVQGNIDSSDVVVVLPLSTMHFFNKSIGGSAYDESRKNNRYLTCSTNRPLERNLLSSNACISEHAITWIVDELKSYNICYLPEFDVKNAIGHDSIKLLMIPGRSEDWNSESRKAVRTLIDNNVNVLCLSGETMYWDIKVDRTMNIVQRDRKRWRWVDMDGVNPLRNILGCNPYDGGFLIDMCEANDPGYGKFTIVSLDTPLFHKTDLHVDSLLNLPSVAYDGLPISGYDANGKPILEPFDSKAWVDVQLFGFCCGKDSPDKKVGCFARMDAGDGKGTVIHMGSMGWSMSHAFVGDHNPAKIVLTNVLHALLHDSTLGEDKNNGGVMIPEFDYHLESCPICGDTLELVENKQNCKTCGSRARLRSMVPLVDNYLTPRFENNPVVESPLLSFAMTGSEKKILQRVFQHFKSVSLYGSYSSNHEIGVDMRDLSRYAPNSFSGVFGCLLFDYFLEHEQALQECFRVIVPGGIFITHIAPYRILEGSAAPEHKNKIKPKEGYFEYLPENAELLDVKVGKQWFAAAVQKAGFDVSLVRIRDTVTGVISEWFIGKKPLGDYKAISKNSDDVLCTSNTKSDNDAINSQQNGENIILNVHECTICNTSLDLIEKGEKCVSCNAPARLRSIVPLVDEYIKNLLNKNCFSLPLLSFAMTDTEKTILSKHFKSFKSVSLYGSYGKDSDTGVDMRDLSRYASNSFSGVFACVIFDYFLEQEQALRECFRVIAPGGILFTHIAPYRLVDGNNPPVKTGAGKARPGYFEYLPEGVELASATVGRDWFLSMMEKIGFKAMLVKVNDALPGLVCDWFVGIKPNQVSNPDYNNAYLQNPPLKVMTTATEVFRCNVPWGEAQLATLKIELLEGTKGPLLFLEDRVLPSPDRGGEIRETVAINGSRTQLFVSHDRGNTWTVRYPDVEWDSKIRASFTMADGSRFVRTFSGRMYLFNPQGKFVSYHETGDWHWHGSQGIGQSSTGTVMYAEYTPLGNEDGVVDLSVWRYKNDDLGWVRVFTLPASVRPPEGELRHFHVCRPCPGKSDHWILASGDIGAHNRLWSSHDDGDSWIEETPFEIVDSREPQGEYPALLRFTQFSMLENGNLIWGTDDTSKTGKAVLCSASILNDKKQIFLIENLDKNCIRNIIPYNDDFFILLSESKHDKKSADLVLYDSLKNATTILKLPNIRQSNHSITESLGSDRFVNGVAFFPASGGVLMNPEKRGIFRISIDGIS